METTTWSSKERDSMRQGGGKGRQSPSSPPTTLLISQFMALLFNEAIQGGEAQCRRCSHWSIAVNPPPPLLGGPVELSAGQVPPPSTSTGGLSFRRPPQLLFVSTCTNPSKTDQSLLYTAFSTSNQQLRFSDSNCQLMERTARNVTSAEPLTEVLRLVEQSQRVQNLLLKVVRLSAEHHESGVSSWFWTMCSRASTVLQSTPLPPLRSKNIVTQQPKGPLAS